MADELELLRAADPVPADEGPWRDRPLTARAEHALDRLLRTGHTRRARRRLVLRAEAAVLGVVGVLALMLSTLGTAVPALATPTPLLPDTGSSAVPLGEISRRAAGKAAGSTAGPHRGSHLQTWSLSMQAGPDAAPPVTVPEERITRWNADGSGSELVVATDPQHPGRPVIANTGSDSESAWRTVNDGKVLHRKTYPAGSGSRRGLAATPPPADPDGLREYLSRLYGGADTKTPQLLLALSTFLQEWTPGPRETAAITKLLVDAKGLRPAGEITDRLGRTGQAYVYDGPDGASDATRHMIILAPRTGQVLGIEATFTKDLPDFKIKAGDVLSYEAWLP